MQKVLILFLSLAYVSSQAQTKLIAHKSHSGSDAEFNLALENNLFDIDEDNLGMAPERFEIKKRNLHPQLDSVIFVSETKAIVVTSSVCTSVNAYNPEETRHEVWKPGKEIAINHPLFKNQHSLDSIKKVLKNQYGFENPIDEVVFVGYDNVQPEKTVETVAEDNHFKNKKQRTKSKMIIDHSIMAVLSITLAAFFSGLFMLNRQN